MVGIGRGVVALAVVVCVAQMAWGAPLVGASANTLPQGGFMIDTWAVWKDYTRIYVSEEDGWEDLPNGSKLQAASFVPRLYYGVTDWLTVRASLPLEHRFRSLSEYEDGEDSAAGLGDIVVDPKIQIIRAKEGYPRIALLAGVQFPTGDTESEPRLSDGSTDFLVGAAVTHRGGDVTGHAYMTRWLNGESEDGADVKDLWIGCLSIETPVSEHWTLLWEGKAYAGETPADLYRVYLGPGLSWSDGRRVTV